MKCRCHCQVSNLKRYCKEINILDENYKITITRQLIFESHPVRQCGQDNDDEYPQRGYLSLQPRSQGFYLQGESPGNCINRVINQPGQD